MSFKVVSWKSSLKRNFIRFSGPFAARRQLFMNYLRRLFIMTVFLLLCSTAATAQQIHTYTDQDSLRAGDLFTYTLVLEREAGQEFLNYPDQSSFNENVFQLIDLEHHRVTASRDSLVYTLQFFGIEDTRIPEFDIRVLSQEGDTLTAHSNPIPIAFSPLVVEGEEQFRPFKPIFEFAASVWPWLIGLLILILAGWLYYNYRQREPEPVPQPAVPRSPLPFNNPLIELKETLDRLSKHLPTKLHEELDPFYVSLGDAIRQYLERVYEIKALEMTSGEILRALQRLSVDRDLVRSCRIVLGQADMVKFARFEPEPDDVRKALDTGYQFHETAAGIDRDLIETMRKDHETSEEQLIREELDE